MTNKHNKKRNTGLIYEFLVRSISSSIVNKDEKKRNVALNIIKKHFKKNSELYREFRLFNALASTTTLSESVADSILETAKVASKQYDEKILDEEKSLLIRDINYFLGDKEFFNRRFNEYKIYATIQTLLNEWRSDKFKDIVKIAEYEDSLKKWLMSEKVKEKINKDPEVDPLVEKIMTEKFNEEYNQSLTDEQKEIIRSYVFNETKGDSLRKCLVKIKDDTLKEINAYTSKLNENKNAYVVNKLEQTKEVIEKLRIDNVEINDMIVDKFLDICKLKKELLDKD